MPAIPEPPAPAATPEARPPRVWVTLGRKDGDNGQILGLAEALRWPFEVKRFAYRRTELLTNLLLGPNLLGVVKDESDPIGPPWPELIISAGRRNEPMVRWVQRRAAKDGVRTRLVHMGRPWARHERFDLIVTTPQYRLPDKPNILHNATPLHRVTPGRLEAEGAAWAKHFARLPRPFVVVLIGGKAGVYVFDDEAAELLGRAAARLASDLGGSVLVTTSRRTPREAVPTLRRALDGVPHFVFEWRRDAEENPFFGLLALGDRFVVTSDSMSMLTEAAFTRKPVHIFDLDDGPNSKRPRPERPSEARTPWWWKRLRRLGIQPLAYRLAFHVAPKRITRDVSLIHARLVEEGRAVWLGEPFPDRPAPALNDVERAVARVRALFAPTADGAGATARDAA